MFLVLFLSVVGIVLFHELYWKRRNLPPGPIPLPLLGNLLSLNYPPPGYEAFERWTREFGDVYTFWIGNTPYIMINSFEKIKATFVKDGDLTLNKKRLPLIDVFRGGDYGVTDSNGDFWSVHRRFALTTLRDFGLGKNLMQEKGTISANQLGDSGFQILLEVQDLSKKLDEVEGNEVDISEQFDNAIANVINQVLFGYRFDETRQDEVEKLKFIIDAPIKLFGTFFAFLKVNLPILTKILPNDGFEKNIHDFHDVCFEFFYKQIDEHRKTIDFESDENSDFVETYLKEQKKREDAGDKDTFSTIQLANMCLDFWFAGRSTTTNTIGWSIAYLLNTPGVQEKIHEELDRVVGSDRLITTADKNDLPYMNAFINETQRVANILPMNLPHETTRDTTINGYFIPRGTGIVAQISTVMNDEKTFPDHTTLNPDRFIENGKLKKVDELMPFSIGKRQCLGEGLARMELFLFIANFFNRYNVSPSKEGVPSLVKNSGNIIKAKDFKVVVRKHLM